MKNRKILVWKTTRNNKCLIGKSQTKIMTSGKIAIQRVLSDSRAQHK